VTARRPPSPVGRRQLRRALLRHRRLYVAALLGLAVAAALSVLAPAGPATTRVVVAAHDLAAGTVVASSDLGSVDLPDADVPDGAARASEPLVGRSVAGPVRRGEVLTDARLVSQAAGPGGRPLVAVPVRMADPGSAAYVRPGDHVDLVAVAIDNAYAPGVDDRAARPGLVIAEGAVVLAGPPDDARSGTDTAGLLLVGLPAAAARTVAAVAATARLTLTIVPATTSR
jgi:Flp pilus assembly protein CpaB